MTEMVEMLWYVIAIVILMWLWLKMKKICEG